MDITINNEDNLQQKIKEIVSLSRGQSKEWIPGKDWVLYAGHSFTDDEFVAGIESMHKCLRNLMCWAISHLIF